MNPPYSGPVSNQRAYMPPFNQPPLSNSFNPYPVHGGSGPTKPSMPYGGGQNGAMIDNCIGPYSSNQSTSQVQSASVPPASQMVNNQLSHDMNAMRLSQNQNHPLLPTNPLPQRPTNSMPPVSLSPNPNFQQQHYWQQQPQPRLPSNPGASYNHPPGQFPPNSSADMYPMQPPQNSSAAYSNRTMIPNSASSTNISSAPPPHSAAYGNRTMSPIDQSQQPPKMPTSDSYPPPSNQTNKPLYTNGTGYMPPTSQYHPNSNMHARYPPASLSPNVAQGSVQQQQAAPGTAMSFNQSNNAVPPQNRMGSLPQPPSQQSRRLDPDNMPSPIQVIEDDRKLRSGTFSTAQRGVVPPLVTTNFTVIDEGVCSPRFMRSTVYNVPTTADMLKQTSVPFALAISPFARLHEGENLPPIVDPGEEGPVRCHRCRAYMSPFMQFIDAGRRFQCLLCKTTSEVPMHYFTHLDHMGERVDKLERPELCLGSYEFIVNRDYCKEGKYPNWPAFIFLLDVSYNAIRSGMVKTLCENMKEVLASLPREYNDPESKIRVGFITYSSVVHFYNISGSLAQPQMLVVSDVHDMFMPLLDGFLVRVSEAEQVIDSLLEQIPAMFMDNRETETLLGPAIQAGLEALKAAECAGKLFVFHSSLPLAEAPGKLRNRDDRKLLGSDKEKTLLMPQTTFYNNLGQECVKSGCSIDLFLFNNAYVDVATLGQVCRLTGGQLYKYTYFQSDIDGERFIEDLKRDIEKPIAFDAVLRVRTSTGIRPTDFTGSFFMSNTTDVELASVDCDASLSIEIKYDDKLNEDEGVFVQCAVLYTSCSGQRRLRVHNLALNACTQMAELFRNCELDAMMNVFLKEGVRRITEETPKQVKDHFISTSAQILACYRKNCAQVSSAGQLILPECMKLLPLYINCLIKCDALAGGQEMSTDDRSFIMLSALSMDVDASAAYLYPRLVPLHDVDPELEDVTIPVALRCSIERLKENGVYLIENGLNMFLWIGMNADARWVQDVFDAPTVARIDTDKCYLLELQTPLSQCIRRIAEQVQSERPRRCMKFYIVRQGDKLELPFRQLLVEDRTTEGSAAYVDFLCHLHKEIRSMLS